MSALLLINNALSVPLILVCWWLAHQNAGGHEPFGRSIATGYSVLALVASANMMFRNVDELFFALPVSLVISKAVLVATLGLVATRLSIIHPPPN